MAFFCPFFGANIRNTVPLPPKKTKNEKQNTKSPPFPQKQSAILENQKNAIFELKMCSISPNSQTLSRKTVFGHNA